MSDDPKTPPDNIVPITPTTEVAPPSTPPPTTFIDSVDPADIQSLDLEKLRENMVKGIYTLEAALFTQSGFEYERIAKMRTLISGMENTLFDATTMAKLTTQEKISLYRTMTGNMNNSLTFLQTLHGSIATGLEAVSHIEKLKSQRGQVTAPQETDDQKLAQVKAMVQEKIKKKLGL